MPDARWGDPREYGDRDHGDERPRVYDERDREERDPRDGLMHDLDLPRGEERELVVDREAAVAAVVFPGRNRVRRKSIQSNRRNRATFQLLGAV